MAGEITVADIARLTDLQREVLSDIATGGDGFAHGVRPLGRLLDLGYIVQVGTKRLPRRSGELEGRFAAVTIPVYECVLGVHIAWAEWCSSADDAPSLLDATPTAVRRARLVRAVRGEVPAADVAALWVAIVAVLASDRFGARAVAVLWLRFGLGGGGLDEGQPRTLDETGEVLGVSRERVRQIEATTLRHLRGELAGFGL